MAHRRNIEGPGLAVVGMLTFLYQLALCDMAVLENPCLHAYLLPPCLPASGRSSWRVMRCCRGCRPTHTLVPAAPATLCIVGYRRPLCLGVIWLSTWPAIHLSLLASSLNMRGDCSVPLVWGTHYRADVGHQ